MNGDMFDLLLNEVLVFTISYVLMLKGLNLRRFTPLGKSLALNNVTFSLVYLSVGLGYFFPVFRTAPWSYVIRLAILFTSLRVLWEMQYAFGGWRTLHRRAWRSVVDWVRRRPQRDESELEGY